MPVSIPYKRVKNQRPPSFTYPLPFQFQSPINGSKTTEAKELYIMLGEFQSPINGSKTRQAATAQHVRLCFNPL